MWHIGIDLHKRVAELVAIDTETGELRQLGQCRAMVSALIEQLTDLSEVALVVMEAVNGSARVYHSLTAAGYKVALVGGWVVEQMRVGQRDKTDRSDAELLARFAVQLESGISQERVWPVGEQQLSLRQLTRTRAKLVSQRTALINVLHGLVQAQGLIMPKGKLNSDSGRRLIRSLVLAPEAQLAVHSLLSLVQQLNDVIRAMNKQLEQIARRHQTIKRLCTVPGLGPVLAATIYAEIGQLGRFTDKGKLRAYAGLVPRLKQSSDFARHGPLRRACNKHLKRALVQAANIIGTRCPGRLLNRYWWHKWHRHKQAAKVANVATARKLVGIVWALWRDGTAYQEVVKAA